MRSEPDVLEYDSIGDLEETIEQVYDRVERLDQEMDTLLEQVEAFLDYSHDMDEFEASADYISKNIPHEALPEMAKQHAERELEDPEQADNWDKLEESIQKAEYLGDHWRSAYNNLWNEFGYSDEKLQDEIRGIPPVKHLIDLWQEEPYRLFEEQETYDSREFVGLLRGNNPGLTMARFFDIEDPTPKQKDDLTRAKVLIREGQEMDSDISLEENPQFWREKLSGRSDSSPWVNDEKLEEPLAQE